MSDKILIIKTGAFGDIILSSLSFKTIKKNFPESKIYLLTKSVFREAVENCPLFEKIFYLPEGRNIFRFLKFISKLRKGKFNIIFDIQGNLKTNFYTFIIGAKKRTGLYRKILGKFFLTEAIKKRDDLNPVEHQKYFFKKIGIKSNEQLELWTEKKKEYENLLKKEGLEKGKYILIHPVASPEWKTKRWLPDRFAELADILIEKEKKVVFIGRGKKEIDEIINKMENKPVNFADRTNISQLLFLIKNAELLITTDSAPLHIGRAAGIKTVGIFGPTDPERHCPPGVVYIYKKVDCSPCYKKKCDKMVCMKEIKVEDVLKEI